MLDWGRASWAHCQASYEHACADVDMPMCDNSIKHSSASNTTLPVTQHQHTSISLQAQLCRHVCDDRPQSDTILKHNVISVRKLQRECVIHLSLSACHACPITHACSASTKVDNWWYQEPSNLFCSYQTAHESVSESSSVSCARSIRSPICLVKYTIARHRSWGGTHLRAKVQVLSAGMYRFQFMHSIR